MKALKLLAFAAVAVTDMPAAVIGYNVGWSGSAGYTLSGSFTFDDANGGDGRIDESELLSFSMTGFLAGNPVGNYSLASPYSGAEPFNFNFNPGTSAFFFGGNSNFFNGQNWNDDGNTGSSCGSPGLGSNAGSGSQDLCVDGNFVSRARPELPHF